MSDDKQGGPKTSDADRAKIISDKGAPGGPAGVKGNVKPGGSGGEKGGKK